MHATDPLDRWEEEQQATADPSLRDYAALARDDPGAVFGLGFLAAATVFAAGQASLAFADLHGAGFWVVGTVGLTFVLLVGLDEFDCRANENHTCWSCQQFEAKYRRDES